MRVARYHTACTPEVRVHIASEPLKTQQSTSIPGKCREMYLNLSAASGFTNSTKKSQMTTKSPVPVLAPLWVDSTYRLGHIRVKHHPLK
jgi:hypothetical protein